MVAPLQTTLCVVGGLLLPAIAGAAAPHASSPAVTRCARAEAAQLGARLAASSAQPLDPAEQATLLGVSQEEFVVVARDRGGRVVAVMTCYVDDTNQVVLLRPATMEEKTDAGVE